MIEVKDIIALARKRKELRDFVNTWHLGLFDTPIYGAEPLVAPETNMMFSLLFDIVRNQVFRELDEMITARYENLRDLDALGLGDSSYSVDADDTVIIVEQGMIYYILNESVVVREKDGNGRINTY